MAETSQSEPQQAALLESLRGVRIGGRYVVEKVLGSGGMGLVASARYPELDQRVAVKFLKPQYAADQLLSARFLREAKIAATVESPHLVRVFDVGRLNDGIPFMVMELLSGHDLRAEMEKGPMSIEDAVDIVMQACVGLGQVHANSVVHRDLKPSNLFVAIGRGGAKTVKILDFGISKRTTSAKTDDLTATEHMLGTPQYMSPEQIKDAKRTDVRTDIWALGIILYEMLTGARPFKQEGEGVGELFGMIMFTDPSPPRQHRADIPEGLETVLLTCLKRDREERYATVAELASALAPFASSSTQHRVDEVRRALASLRPPAMTGDRISSTGTLVTAAEMGSSRNVTSAASEAATSAETPTAKPGKKSSVGLVVFTVAIVGVVGGVIWLGGREERRPASGAVTAPEPASVVVPEPAPPRLSAQPSADIAPSASAMATARPPAAPQKARTRGAPSASPQPAPPATSAAPKATAPTRDRGI